MRIFIFVFILYFSTPLAWASDYKWSSSVGGQGICWAEVTHGVGNKILVSCDCGHSNYIDYIEITLAGHSPSSGNSEVLMMFDGRDPISVSFNNGTFGALGMSGITKFGHIIKKLRNHSKVYVRFPDGRGSTFTLRGSSKALKNCL